MNTKFVLFIAVVVALFAINTVAISTKRELTFESATPTSPEYFPIVDINSFVPFYYDELNSVNESWYLAERPEDEEIPGELTPLVEETVYSDIHVAREMYIHIADNGNVTEDIVEYSILNENGVSNELFEEDVAEYIRSGTGTPRNNGGGFRGETTSGGFRGGSSSGGTRGGSTSGGTRGGNSYNGGFNDGGNTDTPIRGSTSGGFRPTRSSSTEPNGSGTRGPFNPTRGDSGCNISPCNISSLSTSLNLNALSTALSQIINPVISSLNGRWFEVRKSWPHVEVGILNVGINQLQLSTSNGRIQVLLRLSASAQVYVRTKLAGSARSSVTANNWTIIASAGVMQVAGQRLQLRDIITTGSISDVSIHTTGGLIMKFILKVATTLLKVKSLIRNALTNDIPTALKSALTNIASNLINTIPWKIPIGKFGAAISLAVVDLPLLDNNTITVAFDARTVQSAAPTTTFDHVVPARNPQALTPSSHLFSTLVDQFVFNDYFATWFAVKGNAALFQRATQPGWLVQLNTQFWTTFFPFLGDQYPDANLILSVKPVSAPAMNIAGGFANLSAAFDIVWYIESNGQPSVELASIRATITTGLTMGIHWNNESKLYNLIPQFSNLTPSFSVNSSIVGTPDINALNSILQGILNYVAIPALDFILLGGIPIPATANFQLTNPIITFPDNAILIRTGVNLQF